uniref:SWIM-type domain-containing protein n=1 Tax=Lactuca sativa TaxID=4236 RepID=A0A9R1XPE8_LACSA|nr:hypothetical protein LSAT_V11C200058030 [Lactuca sativa]
MTNEDVKPKVNNIHDTYDAVVEMYKNYAREACFDIRLGSNKKNTDGTFTSRYLLCNREGKPNTGNVDTIDTRYKKVKQRKDIHGKECEARIVFKLVPQTGKYVVHEFIERHNHMLIPKANMHWSRSKRKLDLSQQTYIYNIYKNKVGAKKAYRAGGSVPAHRTSSGLRKMRVRFFYEGSSLGPKVQREGNRKCEEKEQKARHGLGGYLRGSASAVAYRFYEKDRFRGRYNMVFVPFTGIDNHKRCVTFGAGLLTREDTDSYKWLLKCFLKVFGSPPKIIMSNQDLEIKKVVDELSPLSSHRLCMWHITSKLPKKRNKSLSTSKKEVVPDLPEEEEYHFDSLVNDKDFKVTHNKSEGSFLCTCMQLKHVGVLCRHIFSVMRYYNFEKIPERYILKRWCREIIPPELLRRRFKNSQMDGKVDKAAIGIFSTVDHYVSFFIHDPVK